MVSELLRLYDPAVDPFDAKGYPKAWQEVKVLVRELAGNRCVRCGHPYEKGAGEWSPCDEECKHGDGLRVLTEEPPRGPVVARAFVCPPGATPGGYVRQGWRIEAHWRILTVHHLTGHWGNTGPAKADCRWWNLAALCQRCHLQIQGKVVMERPWAAEHSEWFKPYVAGWYAFHHLGEEIDRTEAEERQDELLELGRREAAVERLPV